ncbi:MAG: hypothetical protein FWE17_01190 [Alphaproteobacteria bacterium]|nr:hypothetical protein [Alphaproteobacteria bacterium]MCL2758538.1 hypothetical protein [Alphaproteobacteria bacterium]
MQTPIGKQFVKSYEAAHPQVVGTKHRWCKRVYWDANIKPDVVLLDGYLQMPESDVSRLGATNPMWMRGIKVARHIDYQIIDKEDEGWPTGYIVCDSAPGIQVKSVPDYAGCSASAINKLVHDADEIRKRGFVIDWVGDNLFYDFATDVFTFIDIIPRRKAFNRTLLTLFDQVVAYDDRRRSFYAPMRWCANTSLYGTVRRILKLESRTERIARRIFGWRDELTDVMKEIDAQVRHAVKILPETRRQEDGKFRAKCEWERENFHTHILPKYRAMTGWEPVIDWENEDFETQIIPKILAYLNPKIRCREA